MPEVAPLFAEWCRDRERDLLDERNAMREALKHAETRMRDDTLSLSLAQNFSEKADNDLRAWRELPLRAKVAAFNTALERGSL
ncbi:MAG: hypothetical protein HYT87_11535 [Nitrospirae bacterium]|nr:hypothetical protein [Nitrospirota bacterium]